MAAGSISEAEFSELAKNLLLYSSKNNDTWEIRKSPHTDAIYLVKRFAINSNYKQIDFNERSEETCNLKEYSFKEDSDPSCLDTTDKDEVLIYEYHVVYSCSYSVPVLYFNVYQSNGKLLPLTEIWKRVPEIYQQELQNDKWSILTQQEHPILGRPFYQLHPCHTSMMMKNVQQISDNRDNFLISWLSTVGPVVGLHLSFKYAQDDRSS